MIAGVVAVGLAAVHLLPTFEMAGFSSRVQNTAYGYGTFYDLAARNGRELVHLLLALAGPQNAGGNPWENVGAFGLLWTAAALLAVLLCRRPVVWFHAAVLLFLVLFSLGANAPVYPALQKALPLLGVFRIPSRILLFAGFPLGLLAGHLTQHLFIGPGVSRRTLCWSAGGVLGLLYVYFVASVDTAPPEHRYWWWVLQVAPGLAAVLVALAYRPAWRPALAAAWLGLLVADQCGMHRHFVRTRPVAEVYPANDMLRYLAEHPGSYRVLDRPINAGRPTFSPLTNALCNLYGVEWVRGLNVTDTYRYKQFLNFVAGTESPPVLNEIPPSPAIAHQQLLDLLGVRYLVAPAKEPLAPAERPYWRRVRTLTDNRVFLEGDATRGGIHELPPFVLYERDAALPRAFVVSEARPLPADGRLLPTLAGSDLHRTVVLEAPRTPFAAPPEPPVGAGTGPAYQEAAVVLREPNRVVIEVERAEPGYLVLLDTWYPGWECRTADGRELPVWRADGLFRAVAVPPGPQRLTFTFRPLSFRLGRAVSLGTLAGVLGLAVWVTVRRWRRQPAPVPSTSEPVVRSFRVTIDLPARGRGDGQEKPAMSDESGLRPLPKRAR